MVSTRLSDQQLSVTVRCLESDTTELCQRWTVPDLQWHLSYGNSCIILKALLGCVHLDIRIKYQLILDGTNDSR